VYKYSSAYSTGQYRNGRRLMKLATSMAHRLLQRILLCLDDQSQIVHIHPWPITTKQQSVFCQSANHGITLYACRQCLWCACIWLYLKTETSLIVAALGHVSPCGCWRKLELFGHWGQRHVLWP